MQTILKGVHAMTKTIETIYTPIAKKNRTKKSPIKTIDPTMRDKGGESIYTDMDALQDACLRYLEGIDNGKDINPDYLPAMAGQCKKDSYRYESRRGHEEVADYAEIIGGYDNHHELRKHIMQYLNDEQKQLFKVYYIEGHKQADISAQLGIDQATVSRSISVLNNKISALNLLDLVDVRFVCGITGAEHHTCDPWVHHTESHDCEVWESERHDLYQPQSRLTHRDLCPVDDRSYQVRDYYSMKGAVRVI